MNAIEIVTRTSDIQSIKKYFIARREQFTNGFTYSLSIPHHIGAGCVHSYLPTRSIDRDICLCIAVRYLFVVSDVFAVLNEIPLVG